MTMTRESFGRYWIGNYSIHQEARGRWRVWWYKDPSSSSVSDGLKGEAYRTLRKARTVIDAEIAFEAVYAVKHAFRDGWSARGQWDRKTYDSRRVSRDRNEPAALEAAWQARAANTAPDAAQFVDDDNAAESQVYQSGYQGLFQGRRVCRPTNAAKRESSDA